MALGRSGFLSERLWDAAWAVGVPRGAFWEDCLSWEGGNGENGDIREIDITYSSLAMFSRPQGSKKDTKAVSEAPKRGPEAPVFKGMFVFLFLVSFHALCCFFVLFGSFLVFLF